MGRHMKSKTVLVTGAGGFIASHLVEELVRQDFKVRALVHYNSRADRGLLEYLRREILSEIDIQFGDIQDPYLVDKLASGCDQIFHLASLIAIPYSYMAPQSYFQTNVIGAVNIMQAALAHGVNMVIHTSTSECYGTAQYVPIDEKHPLQAQSPYAASKIAADKIAESYFCSFDLPVTIVRPFNTYGPRQSARAIVPTIITQALSNKVAKLGSLHPTRDLNFVTDTVDGFIKASQNSGTIGNVINLGSGKEISIGQLAHKIFEILDINVNLESDEFRKRPAKSEVNQLLCNNTKAKESLAWSPKTSLDDGLRITVEWIRKHLSFYNSDKYNI